MGARRSVLKLFLLVLLIGFATSHVQGQHLPPSITTFASEDFEAHSQIFSAEPLPDGRTVFGTSEEVLVHDGEGFRHIPVGKGKYVLSIDRDPKGRLFIGGSSTMGGIVPDSSGKLVYHSLVPLLPDSLKDFGNIWNVVSTEKGEVFFNSFPYLFRYYQDSIEVIRPKKRFFQLHLPSSRPVVEENDGLFRIEGDEKVYIPGSKELTQEGAVMAILPSPGESQGWTVVTEKKGLFHLDTVKGKVKPLPGTSENEWASSRISTACRMDPEKNPYGAAFAVGTKLNGVHLLSATGHPLHHIGRKKGLPAELVWKVRPAGGGNLWVASNDGIALLHTGIPFTYAREASFFQGPVKDIARSSPDSPLHISTSKGVWIWDQQKGDFKRSRWIHEACPDLLPFPSKAAGASSDTRARMLVTESSKGLLSIPSDGEVNAGEEGLKKVFPGNFRRLISFSFKDGEDQAILAGGRRGLFVLPGEAVHDEKDPEPLLSIEEGSPEDVWSIGVSRKGTGADSLRIWASFPSKGVMSVMVDTAFSGWRIARFDTTDGLPKGEINVFQDPGGVEKGVLFGTGNGLYSFDGKAFEPSSQYEGIFSGGSRDVFRFSKGMNGDRWIYNGEKGLLLRLIPEKEGHRIDSTVFRAIDVGTIRAIHPEEDRVWIGGKDGLACYFPRIEKGHEREWDCSVRKVMGSDDSLLFMGNYRRGKKRKPKDPSGILSHVPLDEQPEGMIPELPYSENRMEFHFAAPFTDRPEEVAYSYKLTGFDTAWSDPSDKTRKEYTNLPEGSYTFKVKARNIYLHESSTAEYRFRILPPWYRTWSAYGVYSVAGVGFIWLLLWLNSRRLVAQKERLERIVAERTKEIQEEKAKVEEQQRETEKQKDEVEKKNRALEEANETISKQKEEVEEAHQEITQSIDYAQKIQQALLRSEGEAATRIPEHYILLKPQSQVSGDFYWAKEHKGHWYIAAVDCTGHGVPGAFMSMLGISQLNEIMSTDEVPTPGEVLTELRDRVVRELSGSDPEETAKDGMDAAMVRIPLDEEGTKTVAFAGAQNPLYVIRKGIANEDPGSLLEDLSGPKDLTDLAINDRLKPFKKSPDGIEIKGDPMPVGHDEYATGDFATASLQVQKGDMLYMFSDGYADQFGGPKGKKFRYGPFKKLLADLHEKPLEEQKAELDRTFEEWKAEGEQEQIDDVVVIGVRVLMPKKG